MKRQTPKNTYLRGNTFWFQMNVPEAIRNDLPETYHYGHDVNGSPVAVKLCGAAKVRFTLDTEDYGKANLDQAEHAVKLKRLFKDAKKGVRLKGGVIIKDLDPIKEQKMMESIIFWVRSKRIDPTQNPFDLLNDYIHRQLGMIGTVDSQYLQKLVFRLLLEAHGELNNPTKDNLFEQSSRNSRNFPEQVEIFSKQLESIVDDKPVYKQAPTVNQCLDAFFDPEFGNKTKEGRATFIRVMQEEFGERLINSISRSEILELRALIRSIPRLWFSKKETARDQSEANLKIYYENIERVKNDDEEIEFPDERYANNTREKYVGFVTEFFDFCVEEYGAEFNFTSPALGIKGKKIKTDRTNFTTEQLKTFFANYNPYRHNGWGWGPLISLYHGTRGGEVFGLEVSAISDEYDGVWAIHLDKTKTKVPRWFPIHPQLIKWGFIDWVKERRGSGDKMLFPGVKPNKNGNYYAQEPRTVMTEWYSAHGMWNNETSYHSNRHTFKHVADRIRAIRTEDTKTIAGWDLKGGSSKDYGEQIPVDTLLESLKHLKFGIEDLIKPDPKDRGD